MNPPAKSCYLKSNDKALLTVHVPHQKLLVLGRCPETNITDTKCSRKQVQVYADYREHKVIIEQFGKRPCGFNGFRTCKDTKFTGKQDDCLEMLYGKHIYQIEFNPPPPRTLLSGKRSRDSYIQNEVEAHCSKAAKFEANGTDFSSNKIKTKTGQLQERKKPTKNTGGILKFLQVNKMISDKPQDRDIENVGTEQDIWESKENGALLIYTIHGVQNCSKIAAYDMDGTLIKTRSGLVFPKDYDDWQLMYPDVPAKLKELHNNGYKIVIFTNQASIGSGKLNVKCFKVKLRNIVQRIGVPIQMFIATGNSTYRKPAIGMWQTLVEKNNSIPIYKGSSFYVGDAAGRIKNWAPGKKKDHSSADRLLALNLGLKFYTPEEHFLGHKQASYVLPVFNPKNLQITEICSKSDLTSTKQEVILMVGSPGSGKSHFVQNYLNHYGYVNRDSLGSWQKCITVMERHLSEKSSVVVDNTNPDSTSRQRYIKVAKKHQVPVRCLVMSTSIDHAKHNNKFRELTDPSHAKISEVIINSYIKNYQQPSLDEGFTEIVAINFVPKFQNEEHQQLYQMYLLEG